MVMTNEELSDAIQAANSTAAASGGSAMQDLALGSTQLKALQAIHEQLEAMNAHLRSIDFWLMEAHNRELNR